MLKDHPLRFQTLLFSAEIVLSAAIFLALAGEPGLGGGRAPAGYVDSVLLLLLMVGCFSWPLALHQLDFHSSQRRRSLAGILARLAAAGGISTVVLAASAFALSAPLSPTFPFLFGASQLLGLATLRLVILGTLRWLRRRGINSRNVLIIGSGPRARHAEQVIAAHPSWGQRVLGFVDEGDLPADPGIRAERLHRFSDIPRLLREQVIDELIVACPRAMLPSLAPVVNLCATVGVPVTLLTDLFGDYVPAPRVTRFDSMAALSFAPVHHNRLELWVKRFVDVLGAGVGLALVSPVVALAALAIRLDSPGPIFFRQTRCGLHGRRFEMLKLRTMYVDAEERKRELMHLNQMDGPVFKIEKDPRITGVGRWLRRWSLDELPQLWNVLRGDMSLVGPRPPVPLEVDQYEMFDRRRLSMRPGITCLWQVSGRNEIGFADWVKLDLEYIDSWSLSNDFKILARTVPAVLSGTGAS